MKNRNSLPLHDEFSDLQNLQCSCTGNAGNCCVLKRKFDEKQTYFFSFFASTDNVTKKSDKHCHSLRQCREILSRTKLRETIKSSTQTRCATNWNHLNKQFAATAMGFSTQLEPKVGTQPKQDLFSTGNCLIASNSMSNREASPRQGR